MSPRAARCLLFAALALTVPLPFWLVETGAVPVVRLLLLQGVLFAVMLSEGAKGAVGIAAALLGAQVVLYLVGLWLSAGLGLRPLRERSPRARAAVSAGLAVALLAVAASTPLYHTPFRTRALRGDLTAIFE
jgi:hypothetical protein